MFNIATDDDTEDLWVSGGDGTDATTLIDCVAPCVWVDEPSWSLSGDRIAFQRMVSVGDEVRSSLEILHVDTGVVDVVLKAPRNVVYLAPQWSPRRNATGRGGTATQMYPGAQIIFSPDGTVLYGVNGPDGRDVHTWSVASGIELVSTHQDGIIFTLAVAPDGSQFVTGSRGSATLWDASTGNEVRALGNSTVYNAKFSPNGRWIVIVSDDGFSVFDCSSLELVLSVPLSTVGRDGPQREEVWLHPCPKLYRHHDPGRARMT